MQSLVFRQSVFTLCFFYFACLTALAQQKKVTISGVLKAQNSEEPLTYANITLYTAKDSIFVYGTNSDDDGRFSLTDIESGDYILNISTIGYTPKKQTIFVGALSPFLDLAVIRLEENTTTITEVIVSGEELGVTNKMDKKTYTLDDNISQAGGSVLQALQNLPSITSQDGKIQIRGNDKVTILIDGKQTAITGFGTATGLDNIPASAIEKIEIINNPSAKYDANGNAGIINIILKKNNQQGFNGKIGFATGLGALWIKQENFPTIRPQYQATPKFNPSIALNYKKNDLNIFLQADNLYTQTLNKNEFTTRTYQDGTVIRQQLKRNRNTNFFTAKTGIDYQIDPLNTFTISALFGSEKIIDRGDQPFFNSDFSQRYRLWQFLEDEIKTTAMATLTYQHKFKQAGHNINFNFNYTFHRENEQYFFDNILPTYTGQDAFKLISNEHIIDFNTDYIKPLKYGYIEVGAKIRQRSIPTNMQFFPDTNSPLDSNAGGWAVYQEFIPAIFSTYIFENKFFEAELGLRVEYVTLQYKVNPNHNTYSSDGYNYVQPFPNFRLAYKINDNNKFSFFYNRRVDRPNEVDIRIFPKYDDAEIIKVGNPTLKPQFNNSIELAYKSNWDKGYFYIAAYHRIANATITRISTTIPNSNIIYAIFQNIGKSYNTGVELIFNSQPAKIYNFNININAYRNQINAFTVTPLYPIPHTFTYPQQQILSGNIKINNVFHLPKKFDIQLTAIYLAPDIIPQGKIYARFSIDFGLKKSIQKGKADLFLNATDIFNTMNIKKDIYGTNFNYNSRDYYETQVIRLGYNYKF
jgi:outer membrane receptor protein involved in Fe transport